jgi:hypothetical protein
MEKNITETDLILYFNNEAPVKTREFIEENLHNHQEWCDILDFYAQIQQELNVVRNSTPSKTTLNIILEESQHQENTIC